MKRENIIPVAFRAWKEDVEPIAANCPEDLQNDREFQDYVQEVLDFANEHNIENPEEALKLHDNHLLNTLIEDDPAGLYKLTKSLGRQVPDVCRCGERILDDDRLCDIVLADGHLTVCHWICLTDNEHEMLGHIRYE